MGKLNIEILGIKFREKRYLPSMCVDDEKIIINNKKLNIFYDDYPFDYFARKADFIIGPTCSALIETGLLNKDYYVFTHEKFQDFSDYDESKIFDYLNVSYDIISLEKNILSNKPYKKNFSVENLITISKKQSFYRVIEQSISQILE